MSEYIDREAALEAVSIGNLHPGIVEALRSIIEEIPAADVRPIVYCRDCKHAEESMVSGCVYCNEMERARINEGWCDWGEMKEENNEKT